VYCSTCVLLYTVDFAEEFGLYDMSPNYKIKKTDCFLMLFTNVQNWLIKTNGNTLKQQQKFQILAESIKESVSLKSTISMSLIPLSVVLREV